MLIKVFLRSLFWGIYLIIHELVITLLYLIQRCLLFLFFELQSVNSKFHLLFIFGLTQKRTKKVKKLLRKFLAKLKPRIPLSLLALFCFAKRISAGGNAISGIASGLLIVFLFQSCKVAKFQSFKVAK